MRGPAGGPLMSSLPPVGDDTFDAEVLQSPTPVLVDFWAAWCPPCRAMDPVLVAFAAEHPDVKVVAVDADANPGLVERYQALSLPTYKLIRGGEVVTTLVGARPRPALEAALLPHL
ncbi:MAG TPA: thioredoxin family protein [Pseudolysinimonas sp.]|nr:thioredoxin family protein [Pseudolysinimonas sp.]